MADFPMLQLIPVFGFKKLMLQRVCMFLSQISNSGRLLFEQIKICQNPSIRYLWFLCTKQETFKLLLIFFKKRGNVFLNKSCSLTGL